MSIKLKDIIYNKSNNSDKLDGFNSTSFAKTVKIGNTSYDADSSIISLPSYPTIPTIPTTLPNPKSLSWSGYNTGSYDGTTEVSFTIPNNTNQLTNGAGFITSSSIPTSLKNPQKLTITVNGAKTEYDGSTAKSLTLTIPNSITNYVTTDTDQSISGTKTFSKPIIIKSYTTTTMGLWVQKSESSNDTDTAVPYIRFGKYTSDNTASNATINGELGVNDSKELVFYKGTSGGSWLKVLHESNYFNYALPLSGGTITGAGSKLITLVSNSNNYVDICYSPKGTTYTWDVGANSENIFYFYNSYLNKDVIQIDQKGEMKFIGASDDSRYTIAYYGGIKYYGSTGGWAMGGSFYKNDGTHVGESHGGYGSNGGFDYFYYGGGYNTAAMYIKNSKVGIGINNPEAKLHIKQGNIFLYSSSIPYIAFKNDDGSSYYCDIGAYNGVASVWHSGRGWETILTSGNWSSYCAPASHTHNYAGSSSAGGPAIYIQDYGTDSSIKIRCGYSGQGLTASTCNFLVGISYDSANKICSYKDISIAEAKILLGVGSDGGGSYLPLAGGTMANGARISHGGNMYLGSASNAGWIGCQDICSQDALGDEKWSLRTNGSAHFTTLYIGGELITFTT